MLNKAQSTETPGPGLTKYLLFIGIICSTTVEVDWFAIVNEISDWFEFVNEISD